MPKRIALGTATFIASGAMALSGVTVAHADSPVGTLSISSPTGVDTDTINVTTSAACSAGTNLIANVVGSGFPATGYNVLGNSSASLYSQAPSGGYIVPLADTMRAFASANGFQTLAGKYTFTVTCRNAVGLATFDTFAGSIWFTGNAYTSTDPSTTATTTTVSFAPGSNATVGSNVTVTAAVSPAAPGTVQFMDGATPLGTPVAVAAGAASYTTNALALGAHQITAVFTSSSTGFGSSTSAAASYTINPVGIKATTTSLAVSPSGSSPAGSAITLSSTVTPADAAGSVVFTDATTNTTIATVPVVGGNASANVITLTEGSHNLTAAFVPTDTTAFGPSASTVIPYTITKVGTPPGPQPQTENINTTVAPGALALSVAGSNVNLPALTLNSTSTLFAAAGPIQTVTVTDTRAGAPGWALSGQVADFKSGSNAINAQNLGWAPNLVNKGDGVKVDLGAAVAPANAVAPSDNGQLGLKASRTLATATGLGTAQIGADLSLVAPTSTVAGTYTGVLTLTVM